MGWSAARVHDSARFRAVRTARLALLVVPLLLTVIPLGSYNAPPVGVAAPDSHVSVAGPAPLTVTNDSLTVQNQTVGNLSNFWGVGLNPGFNLTNVTNETQGTPVSWVVWPAGDIADTYD